MGAHGYFVFFWHTGRVVRPVRQALPLLSVGPLRIGVLVACLLLVTARVPAQVLQIEKRLPIAGPTAFAVNPYGNLFAGDARGTVRVYDSTGRALNAFSPPRVARVTAIEAWQSLRVFCFYQDTQEYVMLDRFLAPLPGYARPLKITSDQVGFARLATVANDGQLWLFDDADFSLKKYNPVTKGVSLHVPLELVVEGREHHFTALREYQNLVFLQDARSGVLVFDNAGNFRNKIAHPATGGFGLFEDELYFPEAGQLVFIHLYNEKIRRVALPEGINALSVTVGAARIYLLTGKEILVCAKPL